MPRQCCHHAVHCLELNGSNHSVVAAVTAWSSSFTRITTSTINVDLTTGLVGVCRRGLGIDFGFGCGFGFGFGFNVVLLVARYVSTGFRFLHAFDFVQHVPRFSFGLCLISSSARRLLSSAMPTAVWTNVVEDILPGSRRFY